MRKINDYELKSCSFQAKVFEKSLLETQSSSEIFIRRFMYSEFASRLDKGNFICESYSVHQVFKEIEKQFGETDYGKKQYTKDELHWIGYIYRYWVCATGEKSKSVYKIIKPKELRKLYVPYHTLDPTQAVNRILETKDNVDVYDIDKGVAILREVRKKYE